MINNKICELACYSLQCDYDGNDCPIGCQSNCTLELLTNSVCDSQCDYDQCYYDNQNCLCSPGCTSILINNGVCNKQCNVQSCEYDGNDCKTSPEYTKMLTITGFVIMVISFFMIVAITIWYFKNRRNDNFTRVVSIEDSARSVSNEISNFCPEVRCPNELIREICVICLEE